MLAWVSCRSNCHLATPGVAALARQEHIHLEPRFSDQAALTLDDEAFVLAHSVGGVIRALLAAPSRD